MPRLARLDAPGVIHHVIIRGIERRSIFRDNEDRDDMIDRLADLLPATKTAFYAWAFYPTCPFSSPIRGCRASYLDAKTSDRLRNTV